jgi:hypothetical protein
MARVHSLGPLDRSGDALGRWDQWRLAGRGVLSNREAQVRMLAGPSGDVLASPIGGRPEHLNAVGAL